MRNLHTITEAQRGFYNDALKKLGLPAVSLDRLQVDCMGWSPQVAEALAGEGIPADYLRVGGVQYAIIVSPQQAEAPVLMPAHSFDDACIRRFFDEASDQVPNLTERGAVLVTMARNIDNVDCARDLQQIEHISIEACDTAGVMAEARVQREGAAAIRKDDAVVLDDSFRARLVLSAKQFGDLRHEALDIPKFSFGDVRSFYTALVAGGAWIFRDLPAGRVLTVVRECEQREKASTQYVTLSTLEERHQVLLRLHKAKLLDYSPAKYREASDRARRMRVAILAAAARDHCPEIELVSLDEIAWRRLSDRLAGKLPEAYGFLDRFASLILDKAKRDDAVKMARDDGLLPWLAEPSQEVTPGTAAALNSLLAAIAPEDVLRLRQFDRISYRRLRHEWPATYAAWVDQQISLAEAKA
jgi:hypothetical protein